VKHETTTTAQQRNDFSAFSEAIFAVKIRNISSSKTVGPHVLISLTWKVESEANETSQAPVMTDRFTSLEDKINMTAMVRNNATSSALALSFII